MKRVSEIDNICKFKCSSCKNLKKIELEKKGIWWYCEK